MKEPKFLPLEDNYLKGKEKGTERAFESTMIDGWEKRQYIPDAYFPYAALSEIDKKTLYNRVSEFHFLDANDKTVYIAPNEEFVLIISRYRDFVSVEFILDEDSTHKPKGSGNCISPEWSRAVSIADDLEKVEGALAPIFAVSVLPDISTLECNAYYLVHNEQGIRLYYVDTCEKTWIEIEPRVEAKEEFNNKKPLLLEAVLKQQEDKIFKLLTDIKKLKRNILPNVVWEVRPSSDCRAKPSGGFNTMIRFIPRQHFYCGKTDFSQLKAGLDIFKRHCGLPDAVTEDVHRVIDAHKLRFLSNKEWFAEKLAENPEGMLMHLNAILTKLNVCYSTGEYYFTVIRWYGDHGNVDIAVLLQKAMTSYGSSGKLTYIEATRYIKDLLMKDANVLPNRREYLERLSEISLELAEVTENELDFQFAMRIISELCSGNGFDVDFDVDRKRLYLNLLVKYASQVGQLKEKIKKMEAPVVVTALHAAPRATVTQSTAAQEVRPRRNSFPEFRKG